MEIPMMSFISCKGGRLLKGNEGNYVNQEDNFTHALTLPSLTLTITFQMIFLGQSHLSPGLW